VSYDTGYDENAIYRYLDTNGNGTGTKSVTGDYSGAEEEFYIQPPNDEVYVIERMLVFVRDDGVWSTEKYGATTSVSTGISIEVRTSTDTTLLDLTDGIPIKTNGGWGRLCFDSDVKSIGSGDSMLLVRWTFGKSGRPVTLLEGERLAVVLNDDFQTLVDHTFQVQGYKIRKQIQ
jgi:hypothetical protein